MLFERGTRARDMGCWVSEMSGLDYANEDEAQTAGLEVFNAVRAQLTPQGLRPPQDQFSASQHPPQRQARARRAQLILMRFDGIGACTLRRKPNRFTRTPAFNYKACVTAVLIWKRDYPQLS